MEDDFSFLQPLDLITKDVYELRKIIKEKKENLQQDRQRDIEKDTNEPVNMKENMHTQRRRKNHKGRKKENKIEEGCRNIKSKREKERKSCMRSMLIPNKEIRSSFDMKKVDKMMDQS